MDKKTATDFVGRIEAHREKETGIWQEMRARPDYEMHEDKSIESILDERQRARELLESAEGSLGAFDWVDDGTGNFVPREEMEAKEIEPIWPEISAKLHEIADADPKLLPIVEQIDKLHGLAVEKGFPVITRAQFERETAALQ